MEVHDFVDVYANEAHDRFFAAVSVSKSCTDRKIVPLISLVNEAVKAFGLEEYYKDPRPHVSLAWTLHDVLRGSDFTGRLQLLNRAKDLETRQDEDLPNVADHPGQATTVVDLPLERPRPSLLYFNVRSVSVIVGKVVTRIPLLEGRGPDAFDSSEDSDDESSN